MAKVARRLSDAAIAEKEADRHTRSIDGVRLATNGRAALFSPLAFSVLARVVR